MTILIKATNKYTTTMRMMTVTNAPQPPPPLFLPGSAFFPWAEKGSDYDDDDDDIASTTSSITTSCELADDIIEFVAAFHHPCVVVYLLNKNNNEQKQPVSVSDCNIADVISTKVALLLMRNMEQCYPQKKIHDVDQPSVNSWLVNHHHNYSYDSLPTFSFSSSDDDAPLPTYLVVPKMGYHVPNNAAKRARVTPTSSPARDPSGFIPPVYINVPNPLIHEDD